MAPQGPDDELVQVPGFPAPPGAVVEWLTLGDGVKLRTARWILPDAETHGTVLLAQGRSEFIEKYFEVVRELLARGLSVVTFDWRGQGLSSRQLADPRKGHVTDFSEFDADIAFVVSRILQEHGTKPYYALAHSMGGNILLRYLRDFPHEFERAVLTAPMLAVRTAPFPEWVARAMATGFRFAGGREAYVIGSANQDPMDQQFEGNTVTSDRERFERMMALLKADPRLAIGAPTFGWLEAAFRSMHLVATEEFAAGIETQLLLIGAAQDQIVMPGADFTLIRRIKRGMYVMLKAEHEILMERPEIRRAFWACFDPFLGLKPTVQRASANT
ncbi:MAG: alpha/beta hydrolase [Micropepsaceae bacterium]